MKFFSKKILIISILLGVTVAIAGHYYAMHDPRSKKDLYLAYVLGLSVIAFSYFYLIIRRAKELKAEGLIRSIIQEQPEPPYYEHEFFFNRLIKGLYLLLYVGMFAAGLFFIWQGRLIMAGLLILPASFLIPLTYKSLMDRNPQIKIANSGIWIKDWGYQPWEKIQKINIRKDKSGKNVVPKLEIFLNTDTNNPDSTTDLDDIKSWRDIKPVLENIPNLNFQSDY